MFTMPCPISAPLPTRHNSLLTHTSLGNVRLLSRGGGNFFVVVRNSRLSSCKRFGSVSLLVRRARSFSHAINTVCR